MVRKIPIQDKVNPVVLAVVVDDGLLMQVELRAYLGLELPTVVPGDLFQEAMHLTVGMDLEARQAVVLMEVLADNRLMVVVVED